MYTSYDRFSERVLTLRGKPYAQGDIWRSESYAKRILYMIDLKQELDSMADNKQTLSETQRKVNYNLHVMLICHQQGVPKSKALFLAYEEGKEGLAKRLQPHP